MSVYEVVGGGPTSRTRLMRSSALKGSARYPSAPACHSGAVATALQAFFAGRKVSFALDSRATGTTHRFSRSTEAIDDVVEARILAGFHFRTAGEDGAEIGRRVAQYVSRHQFRRLR